MGLARVMAVARVLGLDAARCPVITVGGTNGKGSTVAHLEALFRAAGASTGLFTSPHFVRYNERIRVDGVEVDDRTLIAAFERIEPARGAITLTFFEYNTLAALLIFAERGVNVALLEVGLGGRLDATNIIDADVSVVCSVGLDHRDWLGDTLEQIGAEKAGIMRRGRPAVLSTPQMPSSLYAMIERLGARAIIAERDFSWELAAAAPDSRWGYRGLRLSFADLPPSALGGSIQYRNAAAALAAFESLASGFELNERRVAEALRNVRLAGRFQVAVVSGVEWILDIAHNEPAAQTFARHVRERPRPAATPGGRTFAIVGILRDKDAAAITAALEPCVDEWIACALPGSRGGSAADLAHRAQLPPARVRLANSVAEGCAIAAAAAAPADRVLIFGSVYTVGPALQWLRIY